MVKIIRCRGIGESRSGTGTMLAGVTASLDGVDVVELPWAADYGVVGDDGMHGMDYLHALGQGATLGRAELDKAPAMLLGYSGGAHVAHIIASSGHPNLLGVGLIADPAMPIGIGGQGLSGITGALYAPITVPCHWVFNVDDIICQCPQDSPLRTISDVTAQFSTDNWPEWTLDMLIRLLTVQWQVAGKYTLDNPLTTYNRYSTAVAGARSYLDGSQHIQAYVGAKQRELARWVRAVTAVAETTPRLPDLPR